MTVMPVVLQYGLLGVAGLSALTLLCCILGLLCGILCCTDKD